MAGSQGSSGAFNVQGQYPLPWNCTMTGALMMDRPDAGAAQIIFNLQKNFDDCHLQYCN